MALQDDDLLLVNRGGNSFKTEYSEIKGEFVNAIKEQQALIETATAAFEEAMTRIETLEAEVQSLKEGNN